MAEKGEGRSSGMHAVRVVRTLTPDEINALYRTLEKPRHVIVLALRVEDAEQMLSALARRKNGDIRVEIELFESQTAEEYTPPSNVQEDSVSSTAPRPRLIRSSNRNGLMMEMEVIQAIILGHLVNEPQSAPILAGKLVSAIFGEPHEYLSMPHNGGLLGRFVYTNPSAVSNNKLMFQQTVYTAVREAFSNLSLNGYLDMTRPGKAAHYAINPEGIERYESIVKSGRFAELMAIRDIALERMKKAPYTNLPEETVQAP